eukprot:4320466-Alexandrium_andersonii.AAC.1
MCQSRESGGGSPPGRSPGAACIEFLTEGPVLFFARRSANVHRRGSTLQSQWRRARSARRQASEPVHSSSTAV